VIAPAPDLFLAAQRAQTPVVRFQPESLVADTLAALAGKLAAETDRRSVEIAAG
jgi:MinD-like ATPase involved in chromosome partitioning or flagellar assembly